MDGRGVLQVAPSSVAYLVVHLVTAGVVWKSAGLLPRPGAPPELHEPELMNGMRALAVSFVQIGSMHGFMSAVTMMDAAITWPPLIRVFSTFVIGVCFMRCAPAAACRVWLHHSARNFMGRHA